MECPICNEELVYQDYYGRVFARQDSKKKGDIFKCPNGVSQDGSCDSSMFFVAGAFYTDETGELYEGYPC